MDKNYNTFSFCKNNYKEYNEYSRKQEVNETRLWDDVAAFLRTASQNGYQMRIWCDEMTVVVEYNYQDEALSGCELRWLGENEFVDTWEKGEVIGS
ncbi:MAG: hypothetical protein J6Y20_11535 [Lachnospiraceae bacterium]|nr:hypothetical protein [Lachnospiraceae bacterium]